MRIYALSKRLLINTSLFYTCISIGFSFLSAGAVTGTHLSLQLILLLFSVLSAVNFELWKPLKINVVFKRFLHFLFACFAFLFSFFIVTGRLGQTRSAVIMTALFAAVYAAAGAIGLSLRSWIKKKRDGNPYTGVFTDITKHKD